MNDNATKVTALYLLLDEIAQRHKDPGDKDHHGNIMKSQVRTGYNYAIAEITLVISNHISELEGDTSELNSV